MKMQNKLLPCPFCGETELIGRNQMHFKNSTTENMFHEDGTMKWSYIECRRCGCSTKAYCYEYQSTEKWNTRKPIKRIAERLEEMFKHHYVSKTVQRLVLEIVKGGVDDGETN